MANAVRIESNAAERATVDGAGDIELGAGRIYTAGEGDFCNVELVLEEFVNDLDHSFNRHGFLGNYEPAVRISGG